MEPLLPSKATFLGMPRRPSRLFIILFIASAVLNAVLLINLGYQESRLMLERQSWRNSLRLSEAQSSTYKQQRDVAQADLDKKNAELADLNKALDDATQRLKNTESELASLTARIKSQESQLAQNSAEIQSLRSRPPLFKFESATSRDVAVAQNEVKEVVTAAYEIIQAVYGKPYILHQVTIKFVDSLSIPGAVGEIEISNSLQGIAITIKIIDFDKSDAENVDTIVHEIIHAFHGVAALSAPVMEEGITVATTDAVLSQLEQRGVIGNIRPYINLSADQAANWNASLGNPPANQSFYSLPKTKVQQYYQLAGWSWQQLALERSDFLSVFNEKLYDRVAQGSSPAPALVRQLVAETVPTVQGRPTAEWLATQVIFNPR